jgi:hypothetical protein
MGFYGKSVIFYCKNAHESKEKAAVTNLFVNDGDITSLEKFHFWVNEKNFAYIFRSFVKCPQCGKPLSGKPLKRFEITARTPGRKKGHYEYSFAHGKDKCVLPVDYKVVSYDARFIMEELLLPQIEEIFSSFKNCSYCGDTCKGIKDVTTHGEYPNLYFRVKHQ